MTEPKITFTKHSFATKEEADQFIKDTIPESERFVDLLGPKPDWMTDEEYTAFWEDM